MRHKTINASAIVAHFLKQTKISFINRHLFAAVSFTPVRKAKERPKTYITVTFGLSHKVEAYPNRWTHHVLLGTEDEIDGELLLALVTVGQGMVACVIFSAFATTPPAVTDDTLAAATIVWNYVGEVIFNMLVLVGASKMSGRLIRELIGLG